MGPTPHTRDEVIASLKVRLDAGSKRIGACVVWQGKTIGIGKYGAIDFPRRFADFVGRSTKGKTRWFPLPVSRARMALAYGGLRPGPHVLHRCDNPRCSRRQHLFFGTQQSNMRDKVAKGRQQQGIDINSAKLTTKQVLKIRSAVKAGESQKAVAARFACTPSNVSRIVNFITRRVA